MNLEKLKDTARKLEQKEDWRKAIDVYLKAIQQAESGAETTPDLSLYNRVGDLYLKINDTTEAVRSYERAVDLYADQGFFNNAIALCGKILRVNPGRTQTYLKLSQLHARKNVVIESKRNLIEFLERMNALGQLDQAFQAVKLFADQFSGSQEIRSMLVELLRATSREDEAREQLEKMAEDLEAIGDKAGARKARERLSTAAETAEHAAPPAASAPPAGSARRGDLIFLDTGVDLAPPAPRPAAYARPKEHPRSAPESPRPTKEPAPPPVETGVPEGLINNDSLTLTPGALGDLTIDSLVTEQTLSESTAEESDSLLGLERLGDALTGGNLDLDSPLEIQRQEPPDLGYEGIQLDGVQGTYEFSPDMGAGSLDFPDDLMSLSEPETVLEDSPAEPDTTLDSVLDNDPPDLTGGLPMIRTEDQGPLTLADLEERILDDPENPDVHLAMAQGLLAAGDDGRVSEELELALAGYEDREDWVRAAEMADRLVELTPDSVAYHQKRVELAYRAGDRGPLLEAYLGLGDALAKSGALDKAIAVYGRVIEHDPKHVRAAAALARLGVPAAKAEPPPPKAKAEPPRAPKAQSPVPAPPPAAKAAPEPSKPAPAPSKPAPAASTPPPARKPAPAAPHPPSAPRRPAAAPSGDFVDLGSMVFEEEKLRDTRMRVNRREPQDQDEQREFHEILEQFKRGIDQNLDSEDHEAHYDLGVAFKEMGLLDEAIAEFQKALRAPEGRLRTSEALGMAFFEKGQYAACESVLRRAVESVSGSDEPKIGLLYWLGRASEALGKQADAIATYERALVVDISFLDLSKRVQRLTAGRRQ
ncbi:MAG: tetratricopeptide repeat protein [Gemmatimonadales bacterium]